MSETLTKAAPCLPSTQISPEGLTVAECYLVYGNAKAVASELNLTQYEVAEILKTREVKHYVDQMYLESGYRNRANIASALDSVIQLKLEEMEESEMGSNKDIADLLKLASDIRIKEMETMIKLENARAGPTNQTNIQIVDAGGPNYNTLLRKIIA